MRASLRTCGNSFPFDARLCRSRGPGQPPPETAAELRALGVEPIVFAQCGNVPPEGDYLSVMGENVERLREAYR